LRVELYGSRSRPIDGTYEIDGLAVGHSYTVYAEALNGAVDPSQFDNAVVSLCRNTVSDPGWLPLLGCLVLRWTRALRQGLGRGLEDGVFSFSLAFSCGLTVLRLVGVAI